MKAPALDYVRPTSLDEAVSIAAEAGDGVKLLGGGQSLGPMLNLRVVHPELLIDISRLEELAGIEESNNAVAIGAGITHSTIEDGRVPEPANGLVRHTAAGIAYRAVRNRGTIGGSLAHADPAGDWAPVMMALGANIRAHGTGGNREIAVSKLIEGIMTTTLGSDEVMTAVIIPRLSEDARWGHYKLTRKPGKFADAIAVVVTDPDRGHHSVAIAGPSSPPCLLDRAASVVARSGTWSESLDRGIREAVAADLDDDPRLDPDPVQRRFHIVTVARAARQALVQ